MGGIRSGPDVIRWVCACVVFATSALAEERILDLNPKWEYVADTVMGGVSRGQIAPVRIQEHGGMQLTGSVSLDNNGGFVQMAFDLDGVDATGWRGLEMDVVGNDEIYDVRLRTDDLTRPWQSFRAQFMATPEWKTVRLPFDGFAAHRTQAPLDLSGLRRIGVLAIGREFEANVAVSAIRLYK